MKLSGQLRRVLSIAGAAWLLAGCAGVGFDATGYQSAVQLKYETLSLLDNSTARYAAHKPAADALVAKYAIAAEHAGRGVGNDPIVQQWAAIRDPRGSSAGNAIELWKKAPLRPGQRAERKRAVAAHFDHLICLEQAKQTANDCSNVGLAADVAAGPEPRMAPAPSPRRPPPPPAEEDDAPPPARLPSN
jgi:hypothetical protein